MITTNQPINGGTTSRKESAPQTDILQYIESNEIVSSIQEGTHLNKESALKNHISTLYRIKLHYKKKLQHDKTTAKNLNA